MNNVQTVVSLYIDKIRESYEDNSNIYLPYKSMATFMESYLIHNFPQINTLTKLEAIQQVGNTHFEDFINNVITNSYYTPTDVAERSFKRISKISNHFTKDNLIEILMGNDFMDYYESHFSMNEWEVVGKLKVGTIKHTPIHILIEYAENHEQYLLEEKLEDSEKLWDYLMNKYEKEWLREYTIYDSEAWSFLVNNKGLKLQFAHAYELDNPEQAELIVQTIIKDYLGKKRVIKAIKPHKEDLEYLIPLAEGFLSENELGTVTVDSILKTYYLQEFLPLPHEVLHEDKETIVQHKIAYFKHLLSEIVDRIQTYVDLGLVHGDVDDKGIVQFPEIVQPHHIEDLINFVEDTDYKIINREDYDVFIEQFTYKNVINNPESNVLDIINLYEEILEYVQNNSISLIELIYKLDVEAYFQQTMEEQINLYQTEDNLYSIFKQWLKKNQNVLTKNYINQLNRNKSTKSTVNFGEISAFDALEYVVEQFDNSLNMDISYNNEPMVVGTLEEVFRWCSTMGITLDRDSFNNYIEQSASTKREIEDIFTNNFDDTDIYKDLSELFHSLVPKFTTNKRYTVKDRGYILDAIENYLKAVKLDDVYSSKSILMQIMEDKETLEHKTSRNEMTSYIKYLNIYTRDFIDNKHENREPVSYYDLDSDAKESLELDMIDDNEVYLKALLTNNSSWLTLVMTNFYKRELRDFKEYDRETFEKNINLETINAYYEDFRKEVEELQSSKEDNTSDKLNQVVEFQYRMINDTLRELGQEYARQAELDKNDWNLIERMLQVEFEKINSTRSKFLLKPRVDFTTFYNSAEEDIIRIKAESKNEADFKRNIIKHIESYVDEEYKDEIGKVNELHFNPMNPEFTLEKKYETLDSQIVRIALNTSLGEVFLTRNNHYVDMYIDWESDYIQEGFESLTEYEETKNVREPNQLCGVCVKTGKYVCIDESDIITFENRMSGWIGFHANVDAWYRVAFMGSPIKRFYTKRSSVSKSNLKDFIKEKIARETYRENELAHFRRNLKIAREENERIQREYEYKLAKDAREDKIKQELEQKKHEESYEELEENLEQETDYDGNTLKENVDESMDAIKNFKDYYDNFTTNYHKNLFNELLKIALLWKNENKNEVGFKAILVDKDNLMMRIGVDESILVVTPFYIINLPYKHVIIDTKGTIINTLESTNQYIELSHNKDKMYLGKMIELIKRPELLDISKYIENTKDDLNRLVRLKKIIKIRQKFLMDETLTIVDKIDGTPLSHIEIHTLRVKNVNNKPVKERVVYIFAPSILFEKDTGQILFKRDGTGVDLNNLNIAINPNQFGGSKAKNKLMQLLSFLDLRRSI